MNFFHIIFDTFKTIWLSLWGLWFFKLFVYFYIALVIYAIWARKKYNNPYKMRLYIGSPGCGKTTLAVREMYQLSRQNNGPNIYSNVHVDNNAIPGVRYYDNRNLGLWLDDDSVLFMDEVNVSGFDNRDWSTTTSETVSWLSLHRHNKVAGYFYAQDADIEKKLIKVMDEIYLVRKVLFTIIVIRKVNKTLTVQTKADDSKSGSDIVDEYVLEPFITLFPLPHINAKFAFIPRWSKYYDTYSRPDDVKYMPYLEYNENHEAIQKISISPDSDSSQAYEFTESDLKGMPEKFEEEVIRKYKKDAFAAEYKKQQDALRKDK